MKRIMVVGDHIDDIYKFCSVPRLCPEGPAPVIIVNRMETRPGGASNVAKNIVTLSGDPMSVFCLTASTSRKIRYFCGNHLLFREDKDSISVSLDHNSLIKAAKDALDSNEFGAVIIADYGKGGVPDSLARFLCRRQHIPIFVDAKNCDVSDKYAGAFCLVPNEHEHSYVPGGSFSHIVRKMGPQGCMVDGHPVPTTEQPVFDVTGAGDVFIAALVLRYLAVSEENSDRSVGNRLVDAAQYANKAAGISVRHIGTYAVTKEEMDGNS